MEAENKRPNLSVDRVNDEETPSASPPKRSKKTTNQYDGFRFDDTSSETTTPQVDILETIPSSRAFFEAYIAPRRPVVVRSHNNNWNAQQIVQSLARIQDTVVVEQRRSCYERFGQDRKQSVVMKVSEFVEYCQEKKKKKKESKQQQQHQGMYYLSTQHQQQPNNQNETMDRPPPPHYGCPCDTLVEQQLLPKTLDSLAGNLILESVNLWMGVAANFHTSGLHHDFHDNFYHVLSGRKRFVVFAPHDASNLAVSGTIHCIYPNGLISYADGPTRQDGVAMAAHDNNDETKAGQEQSDDNNNNRKEEEDESEEDDDEKGFTIGRGFDYESSDDEHECPHMDGKEEDDDDDEVVEEQTVQDSDTPVRRRESLNSLNGSPPRDNLDIPNHFCFIDPTVDTNKITYTFPDYQAAVSCTVDLEAGDIFYLPAGWFHCVSSFGATEEEGPSNTDADNLSHIHMAVNYWYHPPDNRTDFDHPYIDHEFWDTKK